MIWLMLAAYAAPPNIDAPGDALPERHWDFTHVALDVRLTPDTRALSGVVVHDVQPFGLPSPRVRLHQRDLQITSVHVDGVAVEDFVLGPEHLDIPVSSDQPHQVRVAWTATPDKGVHFRSRDKSPFAIDEAWSQGEDEDHRHWFPSWDHPSDRFTVELALTVPASWTAVANGELQARQTVEPGWDRWSYRLDEPIVNYLIGFAAGQYRVVPLPGELPMEVVVPRTVSAEEAVASFGEATEMMPWFADLLGHPYPYPVYRQVLIQRFMYLGMENASMSTLAHGTLSTSTADRSSLARVVVAHELAHQWFGDLITCRGWRELWLNEGFARFYENRWIGHIEGEAAYAQRTRRMLARGASTSRPLAARGWSRVDDRPNTSVYARGSALLHMLRVWLGDEVFDAAIRDYVDRFAGQLVETDDLRRVFEHHTGHHLGWFFDQVAHSWGAPTIKTRWSAGEGQLTVSLTQQGDQPPWRGPLEISWGTADGIEHHQVQMTPGRQDVVVGVDAEVVWVAVDPRGGVMAHWEREQPTAAWAAQALQAAPHARLEALAQLGEARPATDAVAALVAVIDAERQEPTSIPYLEAALRSLGELATPEARDALLPYGELGDADTRDVWLRALSSFPLDPIVEGLLERALRTARLPGHRATALYSLSDVRPTAALTWARRWLLSADRSTYGELHEAALDVLAEHGAASDLASVWRLMSHPHRTVERSAAVTAIELITRHDLGDRPRRQLARALEGWLQHEDMLTRYFGVIYLGRLGESTSAPALKAYGGTTALDGHASAVEDALKALRTGRSDADDPDALLEAQAALEALAKRLEELEERLEDLEHR